MIWRVLSIWATISPKDINAGYSNNTARLQKRASAFHPVFVYGRPADAQLANDHHLWMPFCLKSPHSLHGFIRALSAYAPDCRGLDCTTETTQLNEAFHLDIPGSLVAVQINPMQPSLHFQQYLTDRNPEQITQGMQLDGCYGLLALFNLGQMRPA